MKAEAYVAANPSVQPIAKAAKDFVSAERELREAQYRHREATEIMIRAAVADGAWHLLRLNVGMILRSVREGQFD